MGQLLVSHKFGTEDISIDSKVDCYSSGFALVGCESGGNGNMKILATCCGGIDRLRASAKRIEHQQRIEFRRGRQQAPDHEECRWDLHAGRQADYLPEHKRTDRADFPHLRLIRVLQDPPYSTSLQEHQLRSSELTLFLVINSALAAASSVFWSTGARAISQTSVEKLVHSAARSLNELHMPWAVTGLHRFPFSPNSTRRRIASGLLGKSSDEGVIDGDQEFAGSW